MDATNKSRENLSWPDQKEINAQLETIRELAKELRTDYPTDTADEPTNWSNKARNRRNALIRAQFLDNGAFSLISGSEWLELFNLLGFSVDKEPRKRFASHLNWYSFWYADFKPRLSSKYAQRIHWYVQNFLFCLRNELQTEKDYREGKYGAKGQAYFMKPELHTATSAETPQISTQTAETDNVSGEREKAAETANYSIPIEAEGNTPQSPETPQTVKYSTNTDKPRETTRQEPKRTISKMERVHARKKLGAQGYLILADASATLAAINASPIRGDCVFTGRAMNKPCR